MLESITSAQLKQRLDYEDLIRWRRRLRCFVPMTTCFGHLALLSWYRPRH